MIHDGIQEYYMGSGYWFQDCSQFQQLTYLSRDDQTPITQVESFQQIQIIFNY